MEPESIAKIKNYAAKYDAEWRRKDLVFMSSTVTNLRNAPPEWAWSWESIISVMVSLTGMFVSYGEINKRINIPRPNINFSDDENILMMRFWGDVDRINNQLLVLENEVSRRRKLVGVT